MKLARFSLRTPFGPQGRLGALAPDGTYMIDLALAYARLLEQGGVAFSLARSVAERIFPADSVEFIGLGDWGRQRAEEAIAFAVRRAGGSPGRDGEGEFADGRIPLDAIVWEPPVRPGVMRHFAAFEEHMRNLRAKRGQTVPAEWYQFPAYYKGNPHALVGHDQTVWWPAPSKVLDFEVELGVVIGRRGRNIPVEEAEDYIYGFTIMNDFGARDAQAKEAGVGLGPAKGKDFAVGLGPWIVTADEIPDPYALEMIVRVNGEEWTRGSSRGMYWRIADLISYASIGETLYPGDFISVGAMGNGCGHELGRYLQPGDVVELEIKGIGVLRHRTAKEGGVDRWPWERERN